MEQMKKDANLIGILLIIGQVLFYAISFLVVLVSFFTGFAGIGQYVGADLGSLVANGGLLGCYWLTKQKNLKMQNAPRYSFDIKKKMSLLGISLIVLLLWNSMISLVDTVTGHVLSVPMDMDEQKLSIGWMMIMVAVFPALIEEFAFRKVIFGIMRQYGFWVAAMFSSSMFGLMHQNIIQIVFAFGMGLIFCYLYERTGSIVYCMLLHFINNGVSVALPYISGYNQYGLYVEMIVGIISFTIAILGMCYATKKEMIKRWLRNMDCERVRCCFQSVPIILYTVFCIGMSVFTIWIIIQEI